METIKWNVDGEEFDAVIKYYAYVDGTYLAQFGERYEERNEGDGSGESYASDYFDTLEEAIEFAEKEMANCLGWYDIPTDKGYKVTRTKRGLDTIEYVTAYVERCVVEELAGDILDSGDGPVWGDSTLPDKVRDAAMKAEHSYWKYLDYEDDGYIADVEYWKEQK